MAPRPPTSNAITNPTATAAISQERREAKAATPELYPVGLAPAPAKADDFLRLPGRSRGSPSLDAADAAAWCSAEGTPLRYEAGQPETVAYQSDWIEPPSIAMTLPVT